MENDLRYQVRSREIVDLISAMRSNRLTLSAYFQRNLVWRDTHKRDFIDTILKGYPVPQIFLARGPINLETMVSEQCVVDGQQRLNTILEFVSGKLQLLGRSFADLSPKEKERFIKYEVAVIDFDLDVGDPRLKEVFHRLNRTYYSLSAIEKLASEYSASEFLLTARALCGEIVNFQDTGDSEEPAISDDLEPEDASPELPNRFGRDPGISDETWIWLQAHACGPYTTLITSRNVFSGFEFDRKVPLMFTLNVMCTYMAGYYSRNVQVRKFLEDKNNEFIERDEIVSAINQASQFIFDLDLPPDSMWFNKANFFSLVCEVGRSINPSLADKGSVRERLVAFSSCIPSEYALAAREGVSRKSQRELRANTIRSILSGVSPI